MLIVEDSPTQAERLRYVLEEEGYDVVVASNGAQGLAAARGRPPAVVISDIVMPEMDGYAFCKAIKSDEALHDTPVVLLTSLGSPLDVVKGLECGADNFIRKPYDDHYLISRLRHVLANRELRKADKTRMGVEILLAGQRHFITSERQQMLDLLISTYEEAVRINEELRTREADLARSYQALNAIHRVADTLSRCTTEKEVIESALERSLDLPGIKAGWVVLRHAEGGFRTVAARGLPPALEAAGAMDGDCLCRRKFLSGELTEVTNVLECERLRDAQEGTEGLRYHASVPLRVGDRTVGLLNLAALDPEPLSDEDLRLLHGVGSQVAVALGRARLYEHLEEEVRLRTAALAARERQQAAVAELGRIALEGADPEVVMERAVDLAARTLELECAEVLELLPGGETLRLRAGVGWRDGAVGRATVPVAASQAGHTLLSNGPVIVENAEEETRFGQTALLRDHGVVSGVSVVIRTDRRRFGVLGAHAHGRRSFTQDDVHFLEAVANVIAAALERRETEAALRASEERYRALFENANDAVCVLDVDGAFASINRAGERMSGYSREEIVGLNVDSLVVPEHRDLVREHVRSLAGGDLQAATLDVEIAAKDGSRVSLDVSASAVWSEGRPSRIELIARDVTERKRLEAQLLQAQKMEGIGRLAGGVAHDFNNILGVIGGYGEMLRRRLANADPLARYADQILKGTARAAELTRQLLAFSRQQVLSPRVIDLNAVVADMDAMLRRLIGEDVELVTVLAADIGRVKADPGQVGQVILNLAVNARDAMPEGGRLTIETAAVSLGEEYGRSHYNVPPGAYTMLGVSDTGEGMDETTLARIFEPFFTTKPQGKGTGLGLSTVYGIVKQSGGYIWVYSEPSRGTTFKVYLPHVEQGGEPAVDETKVAASPSSRGSETILLVEDDEALRTMITEIVEGGGYSAIAASDGAQALLLAKAHDGPIHLVLTDIVMPRIGGREVVQRLLKSRPDARILYMSGYTGNAAINHGALAEGEPFIQKPFSAEDLLRKIREQLDASPDHS